nr:putative ubiquitin-conjugating enzyme e2 23 [Quercus suber]
MPFFPDDIVCSKEAPSRLAIVERTHQDIDTHRPNPLSEEHFDLLTDGVDDAASRRFARTGVPPKGTVFVRAIQYTAGVLVAESKLDLIDRSLLIGDIVRKEGNLSGVVINTFTVCELGPIADVRYNETHSLRGLVPPNTLKPAVKVGAAPPPIINVDAAELIAVDSISEDDVVIYKDWVGRVDSVRSNVTLMLADNCVVEIYDDLAEHADGAVDYFVTGDIALTKKGHLRNGKWIYGSYNANTPPVGTVVETRAVAVDVVWLERRIGCEDDTEPHQTLEREELDSSHFKVYDRTRRPRNKDYRQYHSTVSNSETQMRLGMRVRFRDLAAACKKYDGSENMKKLSKIERKDTLGYDLNVFDIVKFRTAVTVQWQDLSMTTEESVDLIPDDSIDDEHMAWPAEIAHTLDLVTVPHSVEKQPSKIGVIQTVNPTDRMARIQWCQNGLVERASTGEGEAATLSAIVGTSTGAIEEISLYDLDAAGSLNVRRGDLVLITNKTWLGGVMPKRGDLDWVAEVVDTRLDGRLTVRLGLATEVQDVIVNREHVLVALRSDGTDDWDAFDQEEDEEYDMDDMEVTLDGSGNLRVWNGDTSYGNEDPSDDEDLAIQVSYEDEDGRKLDEDDVEGGDWVSADEDADGDVEMADASARASYLPTTATPMSVGEVDKPDDCTSSVPNLSPEPYDVLEGMVPSSHHFRESSFTASPAHLKRTAKEHKILRTAGNLPSGVFVRTWESRLDLLRFLLIGPSDTPYSDAPFIVDVWLPPQFPTEPPKTFFHSWAGEPGLGGIGRVNPNLYEDGKICLSLLGTWEGNKGEGWNASRSTLLQVIVSLLGLVLVREPYFNEAGYEHLVGLEASKRPSALYNERTHLRARTFVITALARLKDNTQGQTTGIEGFEDVLKVLYCDAKGSRLIDKVIEDMQDVLKRSEGGDQEANGLTIMSKGACIPLRRVLERLKQLQ